MNKVTKVTGGGGAKRAPNLNKVTKVTGDGGAKLNKVTLGGGGRDGGGESAAKRASGGEPKLSKLIA